jgi:hypothetical protein
VELPRTPGKEPRKLGSCPRRQGKQAKTTAQDIETPRTRDVGSPNPYAAHLVALFLADTNASSLVSLRAFIPSFSSPPSSRPTHLCATIAWCLVCRHGCAGCARVRAPRRLLLEVYPADSSPRRLTEEVLHEAIDARTDSLVSLRELGPPDLVHLVKQPLRSGGKPVRLSPTLPPCYASILTQAFRQASTIMSRAWMPRHLRALLPTSTP